MIMLLFVNRPITILLYLLGVCLMILLSFQGEGRFWLTCIWLIPAYSIFYCTSITNYYLLRGNEKFEIKSVDIRIFKGLVRIYWFFGLIGVIMSVVLFRHTDAVLASAIFLFFYNVICTAALKCAIYAKFFSLVLKKNPKLKDFKIDDLYADIRKILLKKVIH